MNRFARAVLSVLYSALLCACAADSSNSSLRRNLRPNRRLSARKPAAPAHEDIGKALAKSPHQKVETSAGYAWLCTGTGVRGGATALAATMWNRFRRQTSAILQNSHRRKPIAPVLPVIAINQRWPGGSRPATPVTRLRVRRAIPFTLTVRSVWCPGRPPM